MWEVINEPEGIVDKDRSDASGGRCTDVRSVHACARGAHAADGLGWNGECKFHVRTVQRFVNRVTAALRAPDAATGTRQLVTLGSWSYCGSATAAPAESGARDLWADSCLIAAGGEADGVIDVLQVHTPRSRCPRPCPCPRPFPLPLPLQP